MKGMVRAVRERVDNLYVTDLITRLSNASRNGRYRQILNMFLKNDPILDFEGYLSVVERIRGELDAGEIRPHFVGCENTRYGHYAAIQDYCGHRSPPYGINIEHGVNFAVSMPPPLTLNENFAFFFQSDYKNGMVHDSDKTKLTFSIGPYVHYARSLYGQAALREMKERLGKVALVYLSHSTHESAVRRNYGAYSEYVDRYSGKYDTVLFCVYWRDVSRVMYETVKAIPGADIVSAGFLYDSAFIRRTKDLLSLADLVVSDEIGTSVGYALYMGKDVDYIKKKDVRAESDGVRQAAANQERVERAILSGNPDEIKRVYEEFWGGSRVRSPDEMRMILEGLDEIRAKSRGRKSAFPKSVDAMMDVWKNDDASREKYALFRAALRSTL